MPARSRTRILAAVVVLALASAGCGGTDQVAPTVAGTGSGTTEQPASSARPVGPVVTDEARPPITWTPCGKRAECAVVSVPVDYGEPAGRRLDLSVIRRPATDPAQRIGSLFVNPGGPGASGVDFLRSAFADPGLNQRFDLISWDPRGVGESAPLDCGDERTRRFRTLDSDPDTPAEQEDLQAAARDLAEACGRADPTVLTSMHTDVTARDLDAVRAAVGDGQLTYLGFSFGTAIGLRYAQQFPGRLRAMVLDGVVDPAQDLASELEDQSRALQEALDRRLSTCASDPACPLRDPVGAYHRLQAQVERAPITAAGSGGPGVTATSRSLGPAELTLATIASAYSRAQGDAFVQGIADAQQGRPGTLLEVAASYGTATHFPAYLGVECTDLPRPSPAGPDGFRALADRLRSIAPDIGAAAANELLPCAYWPAPVVGRPGPVSLPAGPTVLVIGTRDDPATPYSNAVRVAGGIGGSRLLTYTGGGHTAFNASPCVRDATTEAVEDLRLPAPDAVCPG